MPASRAVEQWPRRGFYGADSGVVSLLVEGIDYDGRDEGPAIRFRSDGVAALAVIGPTKPVCKLIGTDGNMYSIIGRVRDALRKAGQDDRAREFVEAAYRSKSYDEVLQLCLEYVEVV